MYEAIPTFLPSRFPASKTGREVEIRLIDQVAVGLEGISAVGHTVEDRARVNLVQQPVEVGVDEQVYLFDVPLGQVFEAVAGSRVVVAEHIRSWILQERA